MTWPPDQRYAALPERICQALRCGFIERDEANFRIIAHPRYGEPMPLSHDEAREYLEAWRKSGLWSLLGTNDESVLLSHVRHKFCRTEPASAP